MHGVEPAFRLPLAVDPPDAEGSVESLQVLLAEVGEGKVLANKPDSLRSDDDGIFNCGGLKPGGTVRRFANNCTLFVDTRADEIANHHLAGRNADARRERCPVRRDKSLNRGDCRHRRPYGPLGVVFMGLRPSEIDEQAIAERLRDIAAETDNFVADRLLVPRDDVLHVLRVEPRGELGRIHEVGEHHGELAPLGLPALRGRLRRRGNDRGQTRRRLQEASTVSHWHAELLQVGVGQVRQNVEIDTMLSEELSIFAETVLLEPGAERVHCSSYHGHGRERRLVVLNSSGDPVRFGSISLKKSPQRLRCAGSNAAAEIQFQQVPLTESNYLVGACSCAMRRKLVPADHRASSAIRLFQQNRSEADNLPQSAHGRRAPLCRSAFRRGQTPSWRL